MSGLPARFAAEAEALVGTPFLLHGRNPETGLDCIGLAAAALARCGRRVQPPEGYGLRNASIEAALHLAAANGFIAAESSARRGDLLLTVPGPGQHHLLVVCGPGRWVHAHAGCRAIIAESGALPPALYHWRLAPEECD